jgi:hypothetical protein
MDPSRWPRGPLYPQKLTLSSPRSGGRSVGIVRSRTQGTDLLLLFCRLRGYSVAALPATSVLHWEVIISGRDLRVGGKGLEAPSHDNWMRVELDELWVTKTKFSDIHVWLCVNVYLHVWLCVNVYLHVWLCVNIYLHVWLCVNVYLHVCLCVNVYLHVWLCMNVYLYVWMYIFICDYVWMYTFMCDYVWMYIFMCDYVWMYIFMCD